MKAQSKIESISLDKLIAHPANPNRMAWSAFKKLASHIGRSGNYEPIVVRRHPKRDGCFEIINGHHRKKALEELGTKAADCLIWDVSDEETLILLSTLNRLSGNDDLHKKSELIKQLSRRLNIKELSKMLPDSRKSIEHLKALGRTRRKVALLNKCMLNATVFFLTDEQKQIVDSALKEAIDPGIKGTGAQKRAWAIVEILRQARRR